MIGYFNYALYCFIIKEYGDERWKEIVNRTGLTRKQLLRFEHPKHSSYHPKHSATVLKQTCDLAGLNYNLFLQKFGAAYFDFMFEKYGDILKSIGTNLHDFLNNIDDIRRHIHKFEKTSDGNPSTVFAVPDKNGALLLHYCDSFENLEYFVIGWVKAAAWKVFGMRSRACVLTHRSAANPYVTISIKAVNSLIRKKSTLSFQISSGVKELMILPHELDTMLPFHVIFDCEMRVCQMGCSLSRLLQSAMCSCSSSPLITAYFDLLKPVIDFNFVSIAKNRNTTFTLRLKGVLVDEFPDGLLLKGQMMYLESSGCMWFICSPAIEYLSHLCGRHLSFQDIPIHDATRQILQVNEQSRTQNDLKKQLTFLSNRAKEASRLLLMEKARTQNLLDEIFPPGVAVKLMRSLPVPAVSAEEVSILFTDIVGFTAICEKSDPEEVSSMLNNLYVAFDSLCVKYDLYKVETIGDAYMAAGGLHRKDEEHARRAIILGLNMISIAAELRTPAGNPIQIRVGIHSGSVVAGVVGTKMPRYCLFGQSVTFANKMESTSEPGCVHISPTTYWETKHLLEFRFASRDRDLLPEAMKEKYDGSSYFVTQRRQSRYDLLTLKSDALTKLNFMLSRKPSRDVFPNSPLVSRKCSQEILESESKLDSDSDSDSDSMISGSFSVSSDHALFPDKLRMQLETLDRISSYTKERFAFVPTSCLRR